MTQWEEWPHGTEPQSGAPTIVWIGPQLAKDVLGDWAEPLGAVIPIVGQTAIATADL